MLEYTLPVAQIMERIKTIDEWFFPVGSQTIDEQVVPAPLGAVQKRDELKMDWLTNHPHLEEEKPMVSLGPTVRNGQPGYRVRTEIVYKPKSE